MTSHAYVPAVEQPLGPAVLSTQRRTNSALGIATTLPKLYNPGTNCNCPEHTVRLLTTMRSDVCPSVPTRPLGWTPVSPSTIGRWLP